MQILRLRTARVLRGTVLAGLCLALASSWSTTARSEPLASPIARLKAGNARFMGATAGAAAAAPGRKALAQGERPFAVVLSCADSRVAPEHVFSAAPGELFVVRSLGEVVDRSVLASLEHGVAELQAPLLVVMGHESCAAVKAAHEGATTGSANLDYLFKAIRAGSPRTPAEQQDLRTAILANVEQVINDALGGSQMLQDAVSGGQLQVVGAYYELSSGRVVFSEPIGATATVAR